MIGIFDSGIGGLSVFREIKKILPDEKYLYFSDNAHCPYGEKSKEYIIERARWITGYMLDRGADIIVIACNTATAAAIRTLREEYSVPFIGMEPAIKPAASVTRTGVVGVLATAGTLKADKYKDTRGKYAEDIKVVERIGQGFVELVEKGITHGPMAEGIVTASLEPLLREGADTIVLGCTHYPFLSETISSVTERLIPDRKVKLIDPAPAVAKHLYDIMKEKAIIKNDGFSIELSASGDSSLLLKMAQTI